MFRDLLQAILDKIEAGSTAALATVVQGIGSTPRHSPAKMVIGEDGFSRGSIGGGSLEFRVIQDAQRCLKDGMSCLLDYSLNGKGSESLGLCGGTNSVFIDVFRRNAYGTLETQVLGDLIRSLQAGEQASLVTIIRSPNEELWRLGAKMLVRTDGSITGTIGGGEFEAVAAGEAHRAFEANYSRRLGYSVEKGLVSPLAASRRAEVELFVDVFHPKPVLVIVGAGHIGQALTKLGKLLDMHVIVVDDRPEYVCSERLPCADDVVSVPYDAKTETLAPMPLTITPSTFVVLATWGWDGPALRQIIGSPAAYIGLVASSRKAAILFEDMRREGIDEASLAQVYVPAGLDLGAESPGEIALAISAEILMVQRRRNGRSLKDLTQHVETAPLPRHMNRVTV